MNKTGLVIFCLLLTSLSYSQGKRDKNSSDGRQLSEAERLEAEAMLINAEKAYILEKDSLALDLFRNALQMTPNNATINFKIAELLTKDGKSQEALPYSERSLELDGNNKYFMLLLAEIHKSLADYDKASKVYQEMIDNIPGTETYLFDLAIIYQYQGKYDEALETYKRAEEVFGMNEIVLREKQKIYLRKRDYNALMADWDQLIDENPGEDRYTIELCEFLISQNMLKEAKDRLSKLKDSKHADLLLSQIALSEGNTPHAMGLAKSTLDNEKIDYQIKIQVLNNFLDYVITSEEFDQLTEMVLLLALQYPDRYEVQAFTGDVLYRLEANEKARDFYLKAVRIDPGNYGVWQNIINIEAELNQYDSVIAHAEKALEYFPNQAALYYFAGTGYLINKDYKRSVQILDQGRKYAVDPNLQTIFYGQMGDAYNSLKQYDKSYGAYEEALKANPDNDHVLNNYSYFLSLRNEELDKALKMSSRLVEMYPDNPTYLDTHGWVLYSLKRYEEALVYLEKAANLQEDGTVIEHYGDVLFKLGKIEEAVRQWKRASQMDDASKNIQKKIADRKLYE